MCFTGALSVVGLIFSAISTVAQISSTNQEAESNQAELARQAQDELVASKLREEDRRRQLQALTEESLAIFGAGGVTIGSGSPLDVIGQQAGESAREQFNDDFNVTNSVNALNQSARNVNRAATNRNVATLFDFGGDVLSTAGDIDFGTTSTQANPLTSRSPAVRRIQA